MESLDAHLPATTLERGTSRASIDGEESSGHNDPDLPAEEGDIPPAEAERFPLEEDDVPPVEAERFVCADWDDVDIDLVKVNFSFPVRNRHRHLLLLRDFLVARFGDCTSVTLPFSHEYSDGRRFSFKKECKYTPPSLQKKECLIIQTPMEMTIPMNEADTFRDHVRELGYFIPKHETNNHVIYDKSLSHGHVSFATVVTALVLSEVSYMSICMAGMRWKTNNMIVSSATNFFEAIDYLRRNGVIAEITQVDIAYNSPSTKHTAAYWVSTPNTRANDNRETQGFCLDFYPLWHVKEGAQGLKCGSFTARQRQHLQNISSVYAEDEETMYSSVQKIKFYNTVAHCSRNFLSNVLDPNKLLNKQLDNKSIQQTKAIFTKINDACHAVTEHMADVNPTGPKLRIEICFRFPYLFHYNEELNLYVIDDEFYESRSFYGMSEMGLNDFKVYSRYTTDYICPDLGISAKIHDGYQYELVVRKAKSLIAILMREVVGRNDTTLYHKFHSPFKRIWFYQILSKCLAAIGFSGDKLKQHVDKYHQGDFAQAYDPDGMLWLLNFGMNMVDELPFDIVGNINDLGRRLIFEHFHINPADVERVQQAQQELMNARYRRCEAERRQGERKKMHPRYARVADILRQYGVGVIQDEHAEGPLSIGIPPYIPAVSGDTLIRRVRPRLVEEPEERNAEEAPQPGDEIGELDAAIDHDNTLERLPPLPLLDMGHYHLFWPKLMEKLNHYHNPNPDRRGNENYHAILPETWYMIEHPPLRSKKVSELIELSIALGIPVRRNYRTKHSVCIGLAVRYNIPVPIPDGYVMDRDNHPIV
jgi:hypothetical protein